MPRPPKPWWWKARQCWAVTLDGRRRVAPRDIGKRDHLAVAQWFAQLERLEQLEPSSRGTRGPLTVAALCESYLAWDEARIAAGLRAEENHNITRIKLTRACAVTVGAIQVGALLARRFGPGHLGAMLQSWQAEGLSPNYVRELGSAVKAVFAWAARPIDDRPKLLEEDPIVGCRLPTAPHPEPRYAQRSEAAVWLRWLHNAEVSPGYRILQRLLIHTGARPSEWTRAKVSDYDASSGILIRAAWKASRRTGKVRRVFVPTRLRRSLLRRLDGLADDSWIFTTPRGQPWTRSNLSTTTARYRRAAIADGVDLDDVGPDRLTNYRWRHTAASSLLMSGVEIATVAELLGTSVHMISRTYGHLLSDHLSRAAETLARRR